MVLETITSVNAFIDALSQKLAVPAEQLFEIVQCVGAKTAVNFYISLSTFVISLIIAIAICYISTKSNTIDSPVAAFGVFMFLVSMVAMLFVVGTSIDYIFWSIDHRAWAFDYILNSFLNVK